MPYEYIEPDVFVEHQDVTVFHTYGGVPGEGPCEYWFTTNPENTRLKETVEAAATRFEDIAAGRAFQPRLHAATGATEARTVLATIPPKENL